MGFGKGLKYVLSAPKARDCAQVHPEGRNPNHVHLDAGWDSFGGKGGSTATTNVDGALAAPSSSNRSSTAGAGLAAVSVPNTNRYKYKHTYKQHRPRRPPPPPPVPLPLLPHSATCGNEDVDFFIAVLAAPHARSARARKLLRETWFKLKVPGTHVVIRFVFALNKTGGINEELATEAHKFNDMIFVDTEETYKNLYNKVNL